MHKHILHTFLLPGAMVLSLIGHSVAIGELVSAGVGMVRGRVVTSREVQMQNLLELALYGKVPVGQWLLLGIDSKAFNKATQDTLLETVVEMEAKSFNVIQITPNEVHEAEKKALKTLKSTKAWQTLEVSPNELEVALRRKIQAKKFIQFRAESSVLPVTDSEAQRYFNENRAKYNGLSFESVQENIKSVLSRDQVDRRLKDWYDVLLNKYQVKNLIAEI
jgi:hypothetical protein